MPSIKQCIYCNKSFLASTYQMITHVSKCQKSPESVKKIFSINNGLIIKNNDIIKSETNNK